MTTTRFAQVFLAIMGLAFCKVGIEALLNPQAVLQQVGIVLDNASALSSMRAVYGGMHFVFGLLCFWSVMRQQTPGLWLVVLYTTGFVVGRTISMGADGTPNTFVLTWLATETFSLAASATLLMLLRQPARVSAMASR